MKKEIRIGTRTISETSPVFVVAEISGNHNQDYGRALELIHAAGEAGADAVKLQTYTADTITIDCDVLQGDGGTRTASVTGGFAALALACKKLAAEGRLEKNPIRGHVAAISAGIVEDAPLLDLCYEEDSRAMVDLNCVMDEAGRLIEIQGTGEGRSFTAEEQRKLVELCAGGIRELIEKQKEILGG